MNWKSRQHLPRLILFSFAAVLALLLVSFISADKQKLILVAHDPAGSCAIDEKPLHIFDQSPQSRDLLFSRNAIGDLWLRDERGRERCVASNVVHATFSPDGKKFAYSTSASELCIETIDGKLLAQLACARDFTWSSNSATLTFSAIAAIDYPELEQTVVYDIESNQKRYSPKTE